MFFSMSINKPCRGIMALFVLRNLVLQARMRSHPMAARGLLFGRTLCLIPCFICAGSECSGETARMRMLAWAFASRLRGWACSPEPSLVGYVISAIILWAGSVIQRSDVVFARTGLRCLRFETARMRRLSWAFAGRLCDKCHNLMSWLSHTKVVFARTGLLWERCSCERSCRWQVNITSANNSFMPGVLFWTPFWDLDEQCGPGSGFACPGCTLFAYGNFY